MNQDRYFSFAIKELQMDKPPIESESECEEKWDDIESLASYVQTTSNTTGQQSVSQVPSHKMTQEQQLDDKRRSKDPDVCTTNKNSDPDVLQQPPPPKNKFKQLFEIIDSNYRNISSKKKPMRIQTNLSRMCESEGLTGDVAKRCEVSISEKWCELASSIHKVEADEISLKKVQSKDEIEPSNDFSSINIRSTNILPHAVDLDPLLPSTNKLKHPYENINASDNWSGSFQQMNSDIKSYSSPLCTSENDQSKSYAATDHKFSINGEMHDLASYIHRIRQGKLGPKKVHSKDDDAVDGDESHNDVSPITNKTTSQQSPTNNLCKPTPSTNKLKQKSVIINTSDHENSTVHHKTQLNSPNSCKVENDDFKSNVVESCKLINNRIMPDLTSYIQRIGKSETDQKKVQIQNRNTLKEAQHNDSSPVNVYDTNNRVDTHNLHQSLKSKNKQNQQYEISNINENENGAALQQKQRANITPLNPTRLCRSENSGSGDSVTEDCQRPNNKEMCDLASYIHHMRMLSTKLSPEQCSKQISDLEEDNPVPIDHTSDSSSQSYTTASSDRDSPLGESDKNDDCINLTVLKTAGTQKVSTLNKCKLKEPCSLKQKNTMQPNFDQVLSSSSSKITPPNIKLNIDNVDDMTPPKLRRPYSTLPIHHPTATTTSQRISKTPQKVTTPTDQDKNVREVRSAPPLQLTENYFQVRNYNREEFLNFCNSLAKMKLKRYQQRSRNRRRK